MNKLNPPTSSIPVRRVEVRDPHQMPSHYSETPGGTIFSTTPGGTRIIYERKFLMNLKSSPLSQTPTKLPVIPGVTLDDHGKLIEEDEAAALDDVPEETEPTQNGDQEKKPSDDTQFDMDI